MTRQEIILTLTPLDDLSPEKQPPLWQTYLTRYRTWLLEQAFSPYTKRSYGSHVEKFVTFLLYSKHTHISSLKDGHSLEKVTQEYRHFLKHVVAEKPGSINNNLVAIEHFCRFLGIPIARLEREKRGYKAPKILSSDQQQLFLESVKRQDLARDRALALVLFFSGIRISECAALNISDIEIESNNRYLKVRRSDSQRKTRLVDRGPLNRETIKSLEEWLCERSRIINDNTNQALWITKAGNRLSINGMDHIIRRIGWEAHLVLSAETLRQTGIAHLVRNSNKETIAQELGRYMGPRTIERYSLPCNYDYRNAMEHLGVIT